MRNEQIEQKDVFNAVWTACTAFRGEMEVTIYKNYTFSILFLKYISDVWNDHHEEYVKQYGDDEARIRRKLERERFVIPKGSSYYDLYDQRDESNIGEIINIALDSIETANKGKLEGVFRDIDFNSEANLGQTKDRNNRLKMLLENLNKPQLDMRPSRISQDVIGGVCSRLIERFAYEADKKLGEFHTPHKISELVAKLCKPKVGDRIYDPTCGSGALLIEAAKVVGDRNYSAYGMEVNNSTWALCRMNMFLQGVDSSRIECCDALTSPTLTTTDEVMKFDNIVSNLALKSKGDYAFISHMIHVAVEKKGRVVVVVPHGVLFRGGVEGYVRESLVRDNLLDAVISLPRNLLSTTSIPVAILIFDRSREKGGANENRKDVLFIDASQDYQSGKNQNVLLDEHIEKILNTYEKREEIEKFAHLASYDEIKQNDFDLNIPRYVNVLKNKVEIDIEAVQQEIDILESELEDVRGKMANLLNCNMSDC